MIDLWPSDIKATNVIPPYAIVKEQGELLGKKTKNLLIGRVFSVSVPEPLSRGKKFSYKFSIYAPSLSYSYDLFHFSYGIELYPVTIKIDTDIALGEFVGIETIDIKTEPLGGEEVVAKTEEGLMEALKKIFASEKTRRVIAALLAQVQSAGSEEIVGSGA